MKILSNFVVFFPSLLRKHKLYERSQFLSISEDSKNNFSCKSFFDILISNCIINQNIEICFYKTFCAFVGTCCGLQTEEAGASVSESGKKKVLPITHQNGSRNPVPPKQSQTFLDEGLYDFVLVAQCFYYRFDGLYAMLSFSRFPIHWH